MNSIKLTSRIALVSVALCLHCAFDDRDLREVHEDDEGDSGEAGQGGSKGGSGGSTGGTSGGTNGGTSAAGKGSGGAGGAGGSSGGQGGAGGSTSGGSAGSAAPRGGSTAGGTGGVGGGNGGSAAGPDTPLGAVDCGGNPLDLDLGTVETCLFQIGCDPLYQTMTFSYCVTYQPLKTYSRYDCGTGVDSCDDYLACRTWGYYDAADCVEGDPPYCDDALAVHCEGGRPWAQDCAAAGGTCQLFTAESGDPDVGCLQAVEDMCATSGVSQCGGQIAYTCIDGYPLGRDCTRTGTDCEESGESATCHYPLPPCSTPGVSCDTDTRIDVCSDALEHSTLFCANGLGCEETEGDVYCFAPGCEPTSPCEESCNGTELTFCYGGTQVTVDCADYGFRQCLETTLSDRTTETARCFDPK